MMLGRHRDRRIRLENQLTWPEHRSGWGYALDGLKALHRVDGTACDAFVDATFCYIADKTTRWPAVPYRKAWIGIVHNPPDVPPWHGDGASAEAYLRCPAFRESLLCCRGLLTLSSALGDWLRNQVTVPVESLIHPTETPRVKFMFDRFWGAMGRRVVHVGWWCRRISSVFLLDSRPFRKALLLPVRDDRRSEFSTRISAELAFLGRDSADQGSVAILPYAESLDYDLLLSCSIVFLDFWDCAASNTVVECAVRNTPMLVNRTPSLEEYLGADYPLFYADLDHASAMLREVDLLREAHDYLCALPKERFSLSYFTRSVEASDLYQALPIPSPYPAC